LNLVPQCRSNIGLEFIFGSVAMVPSPFAALHRAKSFPEIETLTP
jgi:hypothetical protein